jgi:hypothetical protein
MHERPTLCPPAPLGAERKRCVPLLAAPSSLRLGDRDTHARGVRCAVLKMILTSERSPAASPTGHLHRPAGLLRTRSVHADRRAPAAGPRGSLPRAGPTPAHRCAHHLPALPAGRTYYSGGRAGAPRWSPVLVARLCCQQCALLYLTLLALLQEQAIGERGESGEM